MIEPKAAFLAGVNRLCKEAGYDDEDRAALVDTLFLPEKQGIAIIMKAEATRREDLVKRAGEGLCKLAVGSLTEQTPGGHTPQLGAQAAQPAEEPQPAWWEPAADSVWRGLSGDSDEGKVETATEAAQPTAVTQPQATEQPDGGASWPERFGGWLRGKFTDEEPTQTPSRADAVRQYGEEVAQMSPQQLAQGWTDKDRAAFGRPRPSQPTAVPAATQPSATPAAATDELGGRTDMANLWGEKAVEMSPQLAEQGWKGEELAALDKHLKGRQFATLAYKTGLRRAGLSFRPGPGRSVDWAKVNPQAASSPEMRQLLQRARTHATALGQDYNAMYGQRKGYATRGSGFGTGPYQPQAMRGGTGAGTQPGAPTGGALLRGRAPTPPPTATPGVKQSPKATLPGA